MISSSLGTIVRETSNFLVQEQILSAAASSIVFSGLDGLADGGYILELCGPAATGLDQAGLFINDDFTLSNYKFATPGSPASNNGLFIANMQGGYWYAVVNIMITNGYVGALALSYDDRSAEHYVENYSGRYKVQISNINKISIRSFIGTAQMSAGTVARLYRKKQGLPSAFPSAQSMLVADILVPANTTAITISGLDGNLHGGYYLQSLFVGVNTSGFSLTGAGLTFTDSRRIYTSGSVVSTDTASSIGSTVVGVNTASVVDLPILGTTGVGVITSYDKQGVNNYMANTLSSFTLASNLTSMTITASAANGIGTGSRFRIYRRK